MKIALPTNNGRITQHFGHCEFFEIIELNDKKEIVKSETKTPPEHIPGILPKWLSELGVELVIAGGMGSHAQRLFTEMDIKLVTGVGNELPETAVKNYLNGTLTTGANMCDH